MSAPAASESAAPAAAAAAESSSAPAAASAASAASPSSPSSLKGGQMQVTELHDGVAFEKVVLVHPSSQSSVTVYLHGATVTSWKMLGQELLYLSPKAVFAPGKAIRGGIPVVFPQFGPGVLPQHGFARNQTWTLGQTTVVKGGPSNGDISTTFTLEDSPATRAVWPMHFRLTLTVLLKATSLSQQLRVQNLNSDGRAFSFTTLLHTYLAVEHINKVSVRGLQGKDYVDGVDSKKYKNERSEAVIFREEVDRMYVAGSAGPVRLNDGGNCEVLVKATGFKDLVVWNPHIKKTAGMSDMPPDDWQKFVCLEAGTVIEPVTLEAGGSWEGAQGLSLAMVPELATAVAEKTIAQGGKL